MGDGWQVTLGPDAVWAHRYGLGSFVSDRPQWAGDASLAMTPRHDVMARGAGHDCLAPPTLWGQSP